MPFQLENDRSISRADKNYDYDDFMCLTKVRLLDTTTSPPIETLERRIYCSDPATD